MGFWNGCRRRHHPPRLGHFDAAEREGVSAYVDAAVEAGVDLASLDDIGELFDVELSAWLEEGGDPNTAVNIVGLALGEHLSRACDLAWVVATDADGAEMALHGEANDVLIYPLAMIAKRWEQREPGVVPALGRELIETVDALPA